MDLDQLKYFLAIANTGGFHKAAEILFVSQPTLSASIKRLERELGVAVFERTGRGVRLTDAGQKFLARAEDMIQNYKSALDELRNLQQEPRLKLGIVSTLHLACLAELLKTFREAYPHVMIELRDSEWANLNRYVLDGEIDLAITILQKEEKKCIQPLFEQRQLLAVSTSHPFAQLESISLYDLDGEPFIQRVHCEVWEQHQQSIQDMGIRIRTVYRAAREEWLATLIQANVGLSIMPEWPQLPGIVYVPIAELDMKRTIGLKWRDRHITETVENFKALATQHVWMQR